MTRLFKGFENLKAVEGTLRIEKYYSDGSSEKIFEEDNLIVVASRQKILNDLYSTPLEIDTATAAGNLVTIVTTANHGLSAGDLILITGLSPVEYNGVFEVNIASVTSFRYYARASIGSSGSGTVKLAYPVEKPNPINALKIGIGGGLDSRSLSGCSISISTTSLTAVSPVFLITDVGQNVTIPGAGVGGDNLNVIITAFISATNVTVSESASTTVNSVTVTVGQGLYPRQEDPTQTDLLSPLTSLPVTYTVNVTAPSVTFIADADQSTANGMLLTEAGLFKVDDTIFNVKNHPGIPKTSDFGVHYVWTIKYA